MSDVDNVLIAAAACELHPKALLKGMETASVKDGSVPRPTRRSNGASRASRRSPWASSLFWGDDRLEQAVVAARG